MAGYFRFPAIHKDQVVFVSEDDLWVVPLKGGLARRLTAGLGAITSPVYSPDGRWLAFASEEEGHREVYVMPSEGGDFKRLTYLGSLSSPVGWMGESVVFRSRVDHPHHCDEFFTISRHGGLAEPLRLGRGVWLDIDSQGRVVLERNSHRPDPAHWKRYRGGTAGRLWIGSSLDGEFRPLIQLKSNLSRPMWVQGRVYFISDHEGIGNLYSCTAQGTELKRHTSFKEYYARNPQTDGQSIVLHSGGALFHHDVATNSTKEIGVEYHGQRTQRQRKFPSAAKHLESYSLNAKGDRVGVTVRGQVFSFQPWDGAVLRYGNAPGVRYRLSDWLEGGERLVLVSDDGGEERLEIYDARSCDNLAVLAQLDIGRVTTLKAAPKGDWVAVGNHRNEILLIHTQRRELFKVDKIEFQPAGEFSWSPDGQYLAYAKGMSPSTSCIFVYDVENQKHHQITEPFLQDFAPAWDPDGKYLYFLSVRTLDPVYDLCQFGLGFPRGVSPCLVTLRQDLPNPFLPLGRLAKDGPDESKSDSKVESKDSSKSETTPAAPLKIDFAGITERIVIFPVPDGRYTRIAGSKGKVLWSLAPIQGALQRPWMSEPGADERLECFDMETRKSETLIAGITSFRTSADGGSMIVRIQRDLRVLKAGEKPDEKESRTTFTKKSGWVDLDRLRVLIEPKDEWRQMLKEVWRLQRDHFWNEAMSQIDWDQVLPRYLPLVERVNCRSEFSDLVWELQGELGTSHAYDIGGDYRRSPHYGLGFLGARFAWEEAEKAYRITRIIRGDSWSVQESSPLIAPGVGLKEGDLIFSVNGEALSDKVTPGRLLLHRADDIIELEVRRRGAKDTERVLVKTIKEEHSALYHHWVAANQRWVHEQSKGRVGYLHIPDMGPRGYSEFHRQFLREYDYDALIVDVRYNGGGHVSQLLLEKLSRSRLGISRSRWFGDAPTPDESPAGPLVALTNEHAGSDGDIFSHTFKLKKLGPLIGKRTWGGVVGIWPRHALADGSITTQPEFAYWFSDVGWNVENYGTDPDIEIDDPPHAHRQGEDPQLARALAEALALLEKKPAFKPKPKSDVDMRPPEIQ